MDDQCIWRDSLDTPLIGWVAAKIPVGCAIFDGQAWTLGNLWRSLWSIRISTHACVDVFEAVGLLVTIPFRSTPMADLQSDYSRAVLAIQTPASVILAQKKVPLERIVD